jgi:hypothetical protein
MFHEYLHPSTVLPPNAFSVLSSIIARKLEPLLHIHERVCELSIYCLLVKALNEVLTSKKKGGLGPFGVLGCKYS